MKKLKQKIENYLTELNKQPDDLYDTPAAIDTAIIVGTIFLIGTLILFL